jgi:hypothetical protein
MDDECMMTVMMMVVVLVVMYSLLPQTSPILVSVGDSSCKWHYKTRNEEERRSKCPFTVVRRQIV